MLQQTKELVRAGNSDDLSTIQRFVIAFAQQENTSVDAIYPEDPSFVAEINGTVIGAAVIHKTDATHWEIKLLYISGGHRLSGYGRALINAICDFVGPGVELHVKATIVAKRFIGISVFKLVTNSSAGNI